MSTSLRNPCLGLIALLQLVASAQAERVDMLSEFEVHRLVFTGGEYTDEPFQYLVLPPHGGAEAGKTYPLVLFLHGAGERGDDPQKLLIHFPTQKTAAGVGEVPLLSRGAAVPRRQTVGGRPWTDMDSTPLAAEPSDQLQMAMAVLDATRTSLPVDPDRIYLTGLLMGGDGTRELAMRRPELFAAMAPCCGGGDESQAARLKNIPTWILRTATPTRSSGQSARSDWSRRSSRLGGTSNTPSTPGSATTRGARSTPIPTASSLAVRAAASEEIGFAVRTGEQR